MAIYMWRDVQIPADALYFEANTAGSTVILRRNNSVPLINIETSYDGATWTDYTFGDTITLSNVGDKVYFRNKSETTTTFSTSTGNYYNFITTGGILAKGDITYLINKNTTDTLNGSYTFASLFRYNTALLSAPSMPATTLTYWCYSNMFTGCTNLETLPQLPAALTDYCYLGMFNGCSKIKLSTTQTGEYQNAYRIPTTGTGTDTYRSVESMFNSTGGTFKGTPTVNTTYYTSNTVI